MFVRGQTRGAALALTAGEHLGVVGDQVDHLLRDVPLQRPPAAP
jgi:hypothetical protein